MKDYLERVATDLQCLFVAECVCMALIGIKMVCRVGDTYPNQMLQVQVKAYFYRWKTHTSLEVCSHAMT